MADDLIKIHDSDEIDRNVDTRTVDTDQHRQVVVLGDPATTSGVAGVDGTYGLATDIKRVAAGDNAIGRVKITDGAQVADVLDLTNSDPLAVAVVDTSGNQVPVAGAGDDADFYVGQTAGTPIMGVYESSPSSITAGDLGIVGITQNRLLKVSLDASSLDVGHGEIDGGAPVKTGAQAVNALPTAVATGRRANSISDLWGRQLISHIDPNMQGWKTLNATTAQTGVNIWTPGSGKKLAITSIIISTYGTTASKVTLWFAATGTTVYSGHQVAFVGSFAPSSTVYPGAVHNPMVPIFCTTADYCLKITTPAALSIDVTVYGYEWV